MNTKLVQNTESETPRDANPFDHPRLVEHIESLFRTDFPCFLAFWLKVGSGLTHNEIHALRWEHFADADNGQWEISAPIGLRGTIVKARIVARAAEALGPQRKTSGALFIDRAWESHLRLTIKYPWLDLEQIKAFLAPPEAQRAPRHFTPRGPGKACLAAMAAMNPPNPATTSPAPPAVEYLQDADESAAPVQAVDVPPAAKTANEFAKYFVEPQPEEPPAGPAKRRRAADDGDIERHMKVSRMAGQLDMSERWIKDRIKDGTFRGRRSGKEWLVSVPSVNEWLAFGAGGAE